LIAFSLSALLGLGLGLPAGLSPVFRGIIAPPLALIRSTPVLAIILLLLFWFREEGVPIVSAVLMAFPVLLSSVSEGVRSADPALLEMAAVFKMRKRDALRAIRLPSLLPFFISGTNGALGLVWKVVVAGEVLSLPSRAIGTGLHDARIYLDIPKAMAWTVSAILLCVATDAVFALAAKGARRGV
jgi:NitT/TauT family transport system permease protein